MAVNTFAITGITEFPKEHFSILRMLVCFFVLYIYEYAWENIGDTFLKICGLK